MSEIKPNLNTTLDLSYIILCYLRTMLPTWSGDLTDLNRIISIIGQDIMTQVQADCSQIRQQCIEDSSIVVHTLIVQKAIPLRQEKELILKSLQSQI